MAQITLRLNPDHLKSCSLCGISNGISKLKDSRTFLMPDGEVYGTPIHDSAKNLKIKFLALSLFANFLVLPLRVLGRAFLLVKGQFYYTAHKKAELVWLEAKELSVRDNSPIPTDRDFAIDLAKKTIIQLAIDSAKLVITPIESLALEIVSIFGLVAPLYARMLYSKIEHFFSIDYPDRKNLSIWVVNYTATCFQPLSVWRKENLYNLASDYKEGSIKSVALRCQNLFNQYHFYFSEDFGKKLRDLLTNLYRRGGISTRENYRKIAFSDLVKDMKSYIEYKRHPEGQEEQTEPEFSYLNCPVQIKSIVSGDDGDYKAVLI